ncbi:ATP-binding protein [Histophilus somni]|uniref:ATP-binding protein n=1 Tax=Histophilus somni TaxID=731 RepID=UPI00094B1BAE|nr:ATP-binding protein [Histophilus somni]
MLKKLFSTHSYGVRLRLIVFVLVAVFLIFSISVMSVFGLNSSHNALSNLRDRSMNQMFFSMSLGIKTTQISTYANKLRQTFRALEYQEASKQLAQHIEQVHHYLDQGKKYASPLEQHQFSGIIQSIDLLEKSVQELLQQAYQRHVLNTSIISKLNQSLLYLEHIKRLEKRTALLADGKLFVSDFQQIENLIETATKGLFSPETFIAIRSVFSFLPEKKQPDIQQEWIKIENEFELITKSAYQLVAINQRIQFLTYQIDSLVAQIDRDYSRLAQEKIAIVNSESAKIQTALSKHILYIWGASLFTVGLIIILGIYIYRLFGKRLYSITQAMTRLSQGDKYAQVPQQQRQDEIGELARAFYIFQQNVVKLARTDALLKEKSELLERTFLAMRDGLAIFNPSGCLMSCNSQFIQLLHWHEEQAREANFSSLAFFLQQGSAKIYGSSEQINEKLLSEMRSEQEPLEIDYCRQILEWRVSALQDGGLVAFLIDRTQRKKLETDLAHSQKMRSIGHLTGGIAHDFNNLLAVIIGNLDLIDPETLHDKQAKRLQRALKAAENSATLTQRLLAYARKQPLHPTSLDLNQLLFEFSDFMKHSLPATITVRLDLAENLPLIYMDKNQLETALVNLLVNAKDALESKGEIVLKTRQLLVQRTHKTEQMVQLSIIDNGCGMSEETRRHIFEPFFTTKQNGKGSGLGLSMVYGFIRQSKGRVKVQSELGKGTKIHLQLPISRRNSTISTALPASMDLSERATLILIEDQKDLRETLNEQLIAMGYQTLVFENAEQVMSHLSKNERIEYEYLLSDVVLNGKMSGIDLANYIKYRFPLIKILLMTGNHTEYIAQFSEFEVLNKPFKQEELLVRLKSL